MARESAFIAVVEPRRDEEKTTDGGDEKLTGIGEERQEVGEIEEKKRRRVVGERRKKERTRV